MSELKTVGGPVCGACCCIICDRYIMRVTDNLYHERCLICCVCGCRLSHTCFTRDAKLYCRHDYDRIYVKKCLGCSERIGPDELVMRALDSVFHLRCFVCVVCGVRLQKGDQFVVKQGQLFCRPDYEKEVEMMQGYSQAMGEYPCDELMPSARSQDGRRGPKRPRTILTTQQRRAFKASFEVSPKPCRKVREGLAKDTGLSVRIVQVWFQNQRAKMKKIQKKQRLDQKNNNKDGDCSDEKGDKIKMKEEDHSPGMAGMTFMTDSCSDSELGLGGGGGGMGGGVPGAAPSEMSIKRELDHDEVAFYKTMLQSQPREFITADNVVHKMEPGFLGFPQNPPEAMGFLHQAGGLPINPIDRLYSMQTSYFCGEDSGIEQ
ncbi:LIM homeobox transcription factor 1-beta-like [Macrosteles quadrilineatus]|uniref:LIM homeobox transcription factor 1-beta-like n=1 Tax=Macrosteles quadrilineatus TaxID=74068 RepID=UPI0023E0B947|nr:LIM homeobox transcription factor 1-beta-like [Macrosteles quadrilineatus]